MTDNTQTTTERKRRKMTEETKRKISESLKGKPRTAQAKAAISRGKLGKKESAQTIKRKSIAHDDEKKPIIGKHKKDGTIIRLPSVNSVRKLGMSQSNVSANLHGRIKSAYQYIWKFDED